MTQLHDYLVAVDRELPRVLASDDPDPPVARFARATQDTGEHLDALLGWMTDIAGAVALLDQATRQLKTLETKQALIEGPRSRRHRAAGRSEHHL